MVHSMNHHLQTSWCHLITAWALLWVVQQAWCLVLVAQWLLLVVDTTSSICWGSCARKNDASTFPYLSTKNTISWLAAIQTKICRSIPWAAWYSLQQKVVCFLCHVPDIESDYIVLHAVQASPLVSQGWWFCSCCCCLLCSCCCWLFSFSFCCPSFTIPKWFPQRIPGVFCFRNNRLLAFDLNPSRNSNIFSWPFRWYPRQKKNSVVRTFRRNNIYRS